MSKIFPGAEEQLYCVLLKLWSIIYYHYFGLPMTTFPFYLPWFAVQLFKVLLLVQKVTNIPVITKTSPPPLILLQVYRCSIFCSNISIESCKSDSFYLINLKYSSFIWGNKWDIHQACVVKMAGMHQNFFLHVNVPRRSQSLNMLKRLRPISGHLDQTSLANKGVITWHKRHHFLE